MIALRTQNLVIGASHLNLCLGLSTENFQFSYIRPALR